MADPKFMGALNELLDAAFKMQDSFPDDTGKYPKYMPDFDQFVHDMIAWRDSLKRAKSAAEPAPARPYTYCRR